MKFAKNTLILLYICFVSLFLSTIMSLSIGGAYQANIISNIFLPNLGLDFYIGVNPMSIIGYIALIKILYVSIGVNIVELLNILGIYSIITIILSFLLFFTVIPGDRNLKTLIALIYPFLMIGLDTSIIRAYVFSFTVPLCFIIMYFVFNEEKYENYASMFIIAFISWITIGLSWHTLHVMTFILIVSTFILSRFFAPKSKQRTMKINFIILLVVTFLFIWFNLRNLTVAYIAHNPNIDIDIHSLFNKGSLLENYSFISVFPVQHIDLIRYIGYFFLYLVIVFIITEQAINIVKKREISHSSVIIAVLFISDVIFQGMYFFASGSMGPKIPLIFSFPVLILFLNSKSTLNESILNKKHTKLIISILLIIPIVTTSLFGFMTYKLEMPEKQIDFNMYAESFDWIINHTFSPTIISDTHTIGHYELIYAQNSYYNLYKITFKNMKYSTYDEIMKLKYVPSSEILVINMQLDKKHLVYGSLEAWNKLNPLGLSHINQNKNASIVYNDGRVGIAIQNKDL